MRGTAAAERAKAMLALYETDNLTLDEIGDRYGVTRERVRQIIAPLRTDTSPYAGTKRRTDNRNADLLARASELDHLTREQVATALGTSPGVLSSAGWKPKVRHHRGAFKTFTDDEIIAHLKTWFDAHDGNTSSDRYDAGRDRERTPSAAAVTFRFGSWAEAVRRAGHTPNTPQRSSYPRLVDDYEQGFADAVDEWLSTDPAKYSYRAFERHRIEHDLRPRAVTLRALSGLKWSAILSRRLRARKLGPDA